MGFSIEARPRHDTVQEFRAELEGFDEDNPVDDAASRCLSTFYVMDPEDPVLTVYEALLTGELYPAEKPSRVLGP